MEALSDPKEGSGAWDMRLKMAILEWIPDWQDIGFGGKFKFKFWDSMIPITYIKEATLLPKWVN